VLAHELGDWKRVRTICEELNLDADAAATSYWQAQQWAREVSSGA
jgi:hypothetical protein